MNKIAIESFIEYCDDMMITLEAKMTKAERDESLKKATDYYNSGKAKPGSITAKANMVKQYNDRNNVK